MTRRAKLIFLLSLVIAITGTLLLIQARTTGTAVPSYVLGMLAYGAIFVLYMIIDSAARTYKNRYRGR